nr:T9SS type A sorting domain-containing protein [FCB group bacterium]
SFSDLSEECIKLLPPVFFPERLESVEDLTSPFNGSTPELQEFFRSGVSMVNYNGHGAGQIWADNALFTLADVANMNNQGFYPFIANFTCFICSYDDIKPRTTLGEEFIFAPNEGAIGVYGSTGTGWFEEGHALQKAMVGLLQSDERMTQGDLVWLSKVMYLAVKGQFSAYFYFDANSHATLYTMALLGDPGLEIKTPLYRNEIQMNPIISRGDTIILESQAPFPSGYAVGRIFNKDQEPIFRQNLVWQTQPALFTNNNVSISIDTTMVGFPHRGTFRVSYWNPQNSEDGHLFADFYTIEDFMITTVFDSAKIVPDTVTTADSIYFYTKIVDGQGIVWAKAVYYIEDPSTQPYLPPDSVDLNRIDTEDIIWRSDTLPPFTELLGYFIRYYFIAEDSLGNIVSSQTPQSPYKTEKIYDHRPDLETYPGIVTFGGEEQLELTAKILGKNDNRVDSALVQFWAGSSKLKYDIIGNVWIYDISDSIPKYATVIPPFKEGEYAVHIVIDPDNLIDDSDTGNNTADLNITVDRVHVSPALGSNFEDEQLNFHFHDYILTVQPGAVSDSTLMAAAIDSNLAAVNQASLGFYDEGTGINIWMTKHPDTLLTADGLIIKRLIASPQPGMVDSSGAIHRWHPVSQAWVKLPASYEPVSSSEYYVVSSTAVLGKFALLSNFDNIGPFAEITIDGQLYSSGGYVPSRPRIAALFQDVGGVNPNSLWAALDDDTLEMENLSTPVILDNSRSVSTTIHQELAHGEHTITFGASDMSGNCSSISIQVEVADGFDFQFIGNYPNPFKNHTYIVCNLTDQPDGDLTVKIYTVAGRLVRTLIEPARVNYNEIYWDGKDCDGSVLANGVYFYRVTANKGGKKLEKLKKMAKVR